MIRVLGGRKSYNFEMLTLMRISVVTVQSHN